MAIITLKELVFLNKQSSSPISTIQPSERSIQQQQFQLLVRQKQMGLNIEPLINPQLTLLLEQLESFIPGIFKPRKKIYLNTRWKTQLQLDAITYWLEVPINAGVVKNKVRLYEWRIGSVELNWGDRLKLWVACRYLQYQPEDLMIVICAFSSKYKGRVNKIHWNKKDYYKIEQELKSLLREDNLEVSLNKVDRYPSYITNIDEIDEIRL